jgi:hypothetical protein
MRIFVNEKCLTFKKNLINLSKYVLNLENLLSLTNLNSMMNVIIFADMGLIIFNKMQIKNHSDELNYNLRSKNKRTLSR